MDIHTTILVQPMETSKEDRNDPEVTDTKSADLSFFTLTEAMRTTTNVSSILQLVQDVLEKAPTLYNRPISADNTSSRRKNVFKKFTNLLRRKKEIDSVRNETVKEEETIRQETSTSEGKPVNFAYPLQYHTQDDLPIKSTDNIRLISHYKPIKHLGSGICPHSLPIFYEWPTFDGKVIEDQFGPHVVLNEIFLNFQKQSRSTSVIILINSDKKMSSVK